MVNFVHNHPNSPCCFCDVLLYEIKDCHLGNKTQCDLCNSKAYRKKQHKHAEEGTQEETDGINL